MKKFTKLLGIVLIMALVMSMGITAAFAEDYSITVTNNNTSISISGKTYTAYKLFDMTYSGSGDTDPHAYSIDSNGDGAWAWATLTNNVTADANGVYNCTAYGLKLVPTAADPSVYAITSTMTDAQARDLADALESVRSEATKTASNTVAADAETTTISLTEAGYYLVYGTAASADPKTGDGEVVAALALTSTDPTATVNPKASIPTLDKKITGVAEGTTVVNGAVLDDDGVAAVAKVGSTVSYQIDSITPDLTGYDDYTFVIGDSISAGLTYVQDSFELKINNAVVDIDPVFESDNKSFKLTIPYATLADYDAGTAILLTYDCTVNDNALTYDYENNTANLEYSRTPYDDKTNHTPDKKTYVIDLNIDVDKVAENASGKKLDGAEFKLYKLDGTTKLYYAKGTNTITWETTQAAGDTFTTDTNGKLTTQIQGLDKGEYYLEEITAPEGYNLLASPVKVTITAKETDSEGTHNVTYSATTDGAAAAVTNGTVDLAAAQVEAQPVATATIVNNSGTVLPSTGGIGTTIFYVVGSILVVAAGVLLITKKRMSREG